MTLAERKGVELGENCVTEVQLSVSDKHRKCVVSDLASPCSELLRRQKGGEGS